MSNEPGSKFGDNRHRACMQCEVDCPPESFKTDDGVRVAFVCAEHGVHSVVHPFENGR